MKKFLNISIVLTNKQAGAGKLIEHAKFASFLISQTAFYDITCQNCMAAYNADGFMSARVKFIHIFPLGQTNTINVDGEEHSELRQDCQSNGAVDQRRPNRLL
jgi:hypothetical protein